MCEWHRAWHLTGTGFESLGLYRRPKPTIGRDELLLRQHVVTICYSSIKVMRQGNNHPRLAGRDLAADPIILGDECFGVVEQVGEDLRDRFAPGNCIVVSPDLGVVAYGYGLPGGLQQVNVVRDELLDFLIKVPAEAVRERGMFALSLSEPLACIERGLNLSYRSAPVADGRMLIWADANAKRFTFGGLERLPAEVLLYEEDGTCRVVRDALDRKGVHVRMAEDPSTLEGPFDDVLVASDDPQVLASVLAWGEHHLRDFGVLALLGDPKEGDVPIDIGLAHYNRTLVVGSDRADVHDAYSRNTSFGLRDDMTMMLFGAGGPMGQLFLIRCAAETKQRPGRIFAAEIRSDRLDRLRRMEAWMNAEDVITVLDNSGGLSRQDTKVEAVDHAVLLCDDMQAFQEVVPRLAENAIVNAFAGLKGKQVTVPLRDICARGVRVIGHSGVTFDVHRQTLQEVLDGGVNLAPVVAAVGGFDAAWDGLRAADDRSVPGKTVIYQDIDLPITPVEQLTGPEPWSAEAERKLLAEHGVSIRGIV